MSMMSKEKEAYPLKTLHDFLNELDNEWDRFRRAALIGIITSGILLFYLGIRILGILALLRRPNIGLFQILNDVLFLILIFAFVIYEILLLFGQHKFFKKWEKRVSLLLHLEESIMKKRFENASSKHKIDKD
jgi:hypothetical protein